MTKQFNWIENIYTCGIKAEMPNNITLFVSPDLTQNFGSKPKRGTTWRAGVSQWDEKSTISRFGRDEYHVQHKSAKEAMRAAEAIYLDALQS